MIPIPRVRNRQLTVAPGVVDTPEAASNLFLVELGEIRRFHGHRKLLRARGVASGSRLENAPEWVQDPETRETIGKSIFAIEFNEANLMLFAAFVPFRP